MRALQPSPRGLFASKWAKKFCKPALRQLAKFRVHSRSSVIKNRALVSFSALSRLFALIRPTPSAFYHSSRKLTTTLGFQGASSPLGGVRCLATAGLFSLPFLVTKKVGLGKLQTHIEVSAAWWRNTESNPPKSIQGDKTSRKTVQNVYSPT